MPPRRHRGPPYDAEGQWAASGSVVEPLLQDLLEDPYFKRAAPKSTGLEYFNEAWLSSFIQAHTADPVDVQATLSELTARTVANDILNRPTPPHRVLVCGGGVHNADLMNRLAEQLPDIIIESTQHHGMHPDWVEAVLFAWLARERLLERKQHTGSFTGATEPVLLGRIYPRPES